MKTISILALVAALALTATSAVAGKLVTVDDPNVPNCVLGADNADNCENVLGKPVYLTGFGKNGDISFR